VLSVTLITLNEEQNIRDCLESVGFADEIILVDSGSRDRTLEIAGEFPVQIFNEPWQGFSGTKNSAQEKARGDWILNIDADERVSPELRAEIQHLLKEGTDCAGFKIPRRNYFCGQWIRHGGWYPNYQLRLYRKEAGRFASREVHEQVAVNGRIESLINNLEHYTYRSISDYLRRMDRYAALSARQYLKEGRRIGWPAIMGRSWFTFFQMWVLKRGFLDGGYGLLLAGLYSQYTFVKYAKLKEMEKNDLLNQNGEKNW
jgi:glycosyltransferase involved in cell wall biosynthesis